MKKKIILPIAMLLSLSCLVGCQPTQQESNPFYDSESEETEVVDVDREAAQVVIDMINGLNDDSTEEEIKAVIDAYNALTERQKSFVTNYHLLQEQIEKLTILELIDEVNAAIDALDETNPDPDAVAHARELYTKLCAYGNKWSDKITSDRVAKLAACELKVLKQVAEPLLTTAINLDISVSKDAVQFKLLSQRIDDFFSTYSETDLAKLDDYEQYVSDREYVNAIYEIAATEYISTTHNLPVDKQWQALPQETDDSYGYVYHEDLSSCSLSGPQNVQFATKADFSNYKKIAFFVHWPIGGIPIQVIQEKGVEAKTVYASEPSVANQYLYVEVPSSVLIDTVGDGNTHIGGYFEDRSIANIAGFKVSAIVGIGIDARAAQAAVDEVNRMIEALDLDNLNADDVHAARKAYDDLLVVYSAEWQAKVTAANVSKLIQAELIISVQHINSLVSTALSMDKTDRYEKAKLAVLIKNIKEIYAGLNDQEKSTVNNYDNFLSFAESNSEDVNTLTNGNYNFWTGSLDAYMSSESDSIFGSLYTYEWPNGTRAGKPNFSIPLKPGDVTGQNWAQYQAVGFFAQFDKENTENVMLIENNDWNQAVIYANKHVIDASKNLYFYEFSTTTLAKANFTAATSFEIYFSQSMKKISVSEIVGFNYDVKELKALVANANSLTLDSDAKKSQFILLADRIDKLASLVSDTVIQTITGYSDYLTKKSTVTSFGNILYKDAYTTSYGSDYPAMIETVSEDYGMMLTYTYPNKVTTSRTSNIFFVGANYKSWRGYTKFSCFVQFSEENTSTCEFVYNNDWAKKINVNSTLVDAANHVYYFEVNISGTTLPQVFNGNPFISLVLSSGTTFVTCSYLVGIK